MLWAGVPLLTVPGGPKLASLVAPSLAKAVGTPQTVVRSLKEYEDLGVGLFRGGDSGGQGSVGGGGAGLVAAAASPVASALQAEVRRGREHSPLFDTAEWVLQWEQALWSAWDMRASGLGPRHQVMSLSPRYT